MYLNEKYAEPQDWQTSMLYRHIGGGRTVNGRMKIGQEEGCSEVHFGGGQVVEVKGPITQEIGHGRARVTLQHCISKGDRQMPFLLEFNSSEGAGRKNVVKRRWWMIVQ